LVGAQRDEPDAGRGVEVADGLEVITHPLERLITYQGNWAWEGGPRGRPPSQEDLTLFIGEPVDVADRSFGFLLPNRREYARRYYHFVGYVFGFDPADYADKKQVRAALGYDRSESSDRSPSSPLRKPGHAATTCTSASSRWPR
jgi:hypothetical protein